MDKSYYEQLGENEYRPLRVYHTGDIEADEWYARQLCYYHVINGQSYEHVANEMTETEEQIIIKRMPSFTAYPLDEHTFSSVIFVEFRDADEGTRHKFLGRKVVETHYNALLYLVKDVVYVEGHGQMLVTSREVDEERGGYIVYVKELQE